MYKGILSVARPPSISVLPLNSGRLKLFKLSKIVHVRTVPHLHIKNSPLCCTKLTPWDEPSPVTYAPTDNPEENFLKTTSNIFETLNSDTQTEVPKQVAKEHTDTSNQPTVQLQFLKWPMWLLGPSLLLITGMVPTLWLPMSSIFVGPNITSLLSLIGLDCIFNLGATLFLLMADACARPKNPTQIETGNSKAPFSYRFWNTVANITGFMVPLIMLYGSQKGLLQPQLSFISSAVLLGPYFLLLFVQILTEMLAWHWESPVWLVTPVVYEAYRVLQLMRGLKLGSEVNAPVWMLHTTRGLVSWWVLILGVQLMRVAWFSGFAARARKQESVIANGL